MANIDIDIGADVVTARAHTQTRKGLTTNVIELSVAGCAGNSTVRLHFGTPDSLRSAAAALAGVNVEHSAEGSPC